MPISLSSMSDEELKEFLNDPATFISDPTHSAKIFDLDPNAKARFASILKEQGLSDSEIKDRLDQVAMVRLREVDVFS